MRKTSRDIGVPVIYMSALDIHIPPLYRDFKMNFVVRYARGFISGIAWWDLVYHGIKYIIGV